MSWWHWTLSVLVLWYGLNILWVVLRIRAVKARARAQYAHGLTPARGIHVQLRQHRMDRLSTYAANKAAESPDTFPEEWVR